MESSGLPKEILEGAYRIFIDEITEHLTATEFVLNDFDRTDQLKLKDAKSRFHKIRGGAGFFGLSEIENVATDLETSMNDLISQKSINLKAVKVLYERLTGLVQGSLVKE